MRSIVDTLFRRKLLIAVVFSTVLLLTAAYLTLAPRTYESNMKVFVKHDRADSVLTASNTNAVVRPEVTESDVNSERELLSNADMLRTLVLEHNLHRAERGSADEAIERAMRRLSKNLRVYPIRKTSVIHVVYSSGNPAQSQAVLTRLSELYLQHHLRMHRIAGTHEFFHNQEQGHLGHLGTAQRDLASFRRRNNVVLLAEEKELAVRKVVETEQALNESGAALNEVTNRVQVLKRQLDNLDPRLVTQSRVLPNQYSIERLNTLLVELQNRRTSLIAKFNPDDRQVVEIDKQIGDTTSALARSHALTSVEETTEVNPLRQKLEAELASAESNRVGHQSRRQSITDVLSHLRGRLASLDRVTAEHENLARDVKQAENNLVLYATKKEEARIADSLDERNIANVSIAEAPTRENLPARPNVLLTLFLGFTAACLSSIGAAFAAEMQRNTFETARELEAALNLPVLGTLPMERA